MKHLLISLSIGLFLTSGISTSAIAQQKIGCINSNELVAAMPENDSAMALFEARTLEYQKQAEELQVEFNKKYEAFMLSQDSLSPLILKAKQEELASMDNNIQNFNGAARQELEKYQLEVFQPVQEKAQKAIQEVANEQGFTYILDIARGSVLIFPEEGPENILAAVKTKLGLE